MNCQNNCKERFNVSLSFTAKRPSLKTLDRSFTNYIIWPRKKHYVRLKSTCKPRKGLGLFASLFASQLSFQLSTLSSLGNSSSLSNDVMSQRCIIYYEDQKTGSRHDVKWVTNTRKVTKWRRQRRWKIHFRCFNVADDVSKTMNVVSSKDKASERLDSIGLKQIMC